MKTNKHHLCENHQFENQLKKKFENLKPWPIFLSLKVFQNQRTKVAL
jgi:hypothetical protein